MRQKMQQLWSEALFIYPPLAFSWTSEMVLIRSGVEWECITLLIVESMHG